MNLTAPQQFFQSGIFKILKITIYQNTYFFMDLWSIIHFLTLAISAWILIKKNNTLNKTHAFIILTIGVIAFEAIEFTLRTIGITNYEQPKDIFYDIMYGIAGTTLALTTKKK